MTRLPGRASRLVFVLALVLLVACSGSTPAAPETPNTVVDASFSVGQPQNRGGIGDVDRAVARYETTRADLIRQFQSQPWFQDGLTRDESLFVERSLSFVSRYGSDRRGYVSEETVRQKLFRYERLTLNQREVELLLIYEPGQDGERQMGLIKLIVPALERQVGVQYPEQVMTVVNGAFEVNDFNDGQFIRIARCCVLSPFVLAHELAHTYWSMGPPWFNEGMADIYANLTLARLNQEQPSGWRAVPADLDSYYRSRKSLLDSGRFPDIVLSRRLASDGLYEAADVFLLDIRRLIGDSAFLTAAREIYLTSDFGRFILRDKRIEDIFLRYAKAGDQDDVMALFNRLVWGDNGERYRQLKELEGS